MDFLRSKGYLLAQHLRGCIQRGELVEPLPGTAAWSNRLGVARTTLTKALAILQREDLVVIAPRGTRLKQEKRRSHAREKRTRRVRILHYTQGYPNVDSALEWIFPLSEALQRQRISLQVEPCDDARLRSISREGNRHELIFLLGVAPRHQHWFSGSGTAAVILGSPIEGISLLGDGVDQAGAVGHAAQFLLRKKLLRLNLLVADVASHGIEKSVAAFETACRQWPHQPVKAVISLMPISPTSDVAAARRFAARIKSRQGVVVVGPIPPCLVVTALMANHLRVPDDVEVVSILPPSASSKLCPPIPLYRMDVPRYVRRTVRIVRQYFETGQLPATIEPLSLELCQSGDQRSV